MNQRTPRDQRKSDHGKAARRDQPGRTRQPEREIELERHLEICIDLATD